jgi:hypothetical protein
MARRTFFGGVIVHGMLSVIEALRRESGPMRSLDIEFTGRRPSDATCEVDIDRSVGSPVIVARSADGVL